MSYHQKRKRFLHNKIAQVFVVVLSLSLIFSPSASYAQMVIPQTILNLPAPGTMITMSPGFTPTLVKGITIHPENPLEFDFLVDTGDENLNENELKVQSNKLIKYFLAALTVPENEMWVNLSPYEKDRMIPNGFGKTQMGRDLLAQDYILKQLTASLMYPEDELGQKFWQRVYKRAQEEYGTTEIPMNTFNKVWIIPEKAVVYEHEQTAYVVQSHLKVMLEEDYQALQNAMSDDDINAVAPVEEKSVEMQELGKTIIREIIVPEIEKEVNEGKSFAQLRQIYNSVILATWYKMNLKNSLLGQVYVDQNKVKGIDLKDEKVNQKIYEQYLEAFKTGVYNYIREDIDPQTEKIIPRKYFSGGAVLNLRDTSVSASPILTVVTDETSRLVANGVSKEISYSVNVNMLEVSADGNSELALIINSQSAANDDSYFQMSSEVTTVATAQPTATNDEDNFALASSPVTSSPEEQEVARRAIQQFYAMRNAAIDKRKYPLVLYQEKLTGLEGSADLFHGAYSFLGEIVERYGLKTEIEPPTFSGGRLYKIILLNSKGEVLTNDFAGYEEIIEGVKQIHEGVAVKDVLKAIDLKNQKTQVNDSEQGSDPAASSPISNRTKTLIAAGVLSAVGVTAIILDRDELSLEEQQRIEAVYVQEHNLQKIKAIVDAYKTVYDPLTEGFNKINDSSVRALLEMSEEFNIAIDRVQTLYEDVSNKEYEILDSGLKLNSFESRSFIVQKILELGLETEEQIIGFFERLKYLSDKIQPKAFGDDKSVILLTDLSYQETFKKKLSILKKQTPQANNLGSVLEQLFAEFSDIKKRLEGDADDLVAARMLYAKYVQGRNLDVLLRNYTLTLAELNRGRDKISFEEALNLAFMAEDAEDTESIYYFINDYRTIWRDYFSKRQTSFSNILSAQAFRLKHNSQLSVDIFVERLDTLRSRFRGVDSDKIAGILVEATTHPNQDVKSVGNAYQFVLDQLAKNLLLGDSFSDIRKKEAAQLVLLSVKKQSASSPVSIPADVEEKANMFKKQKKNVEVDNETVFEWLDILKTGIPPLTLFGLASEKTGNQEFAQSLLLLAESIKIAKKKKGEERDQLIDAVKEDVTATSSPVEVANVLDQRAIEKIMENEDKIFTWIFNEMDGLGFSSDRIEYLKSRVLKSKHIGVFEEGIRALGSSFRNMEDKERVNSILSELVRISGIIRSLKKALNKVSINGKIDKQEFLSFLDLNILRKDDIVEIQSKIPFFSGGSNYTSEVIFHGIDNRKLEKNYDIVFRFPGEQDLTYINIDDFDGGKIIFASSPVILAQTIEDLQKAVRSFAVFDPEKKVYTLIPGSWGSELMAWGRSYLREHNSNIKVQGEVREESKIILNDLLAKTVEDLHKEVGLFAVFDSEEETYKLIPGIGRRTLGEWGRDYLNEHVSNTEVPKEVRLESRRILKKLDQSSSSPATSLQVNLNTQFRDDMIGIWGKKWSDYQMLIENYDDTLKLEEMPLTLRRYLKNLKTAQEVIDLLEEARTRMYNLLKDRERRLSKDNIDDNLTREIENLRDSFDSAIVYARSFIEENDSTVKFSRLSNGKVATSSPLQQQKDVVRMTQDAEYGGIDLNPAHFDLQIKRDGNGIPLPLFQQPIETFNIEGFVPVIINVTPIANLPLLLGLTDENEPEDSEISFNLSKADIKIRRIPLIAESKK